MWDETNGGGDRSLATLGFLVIKSNKAIATLRLFPKPLNIVCVICEEYYLISQREKMLKNGLRNYVKNGNNENNKVTNYYYGKQHWVYLLLLWENLCLVCSKA